MDQLFPLLGLLLIIVSMLQFGLWTGRGFRLRHQEKKRFDVELEKLRAEIYQIRNNAGSSGETDQANGESSLSTVSLQSASSTVEQPVAKNPTTQNTATRLPAQKEPEQAITKPLAEGDWKGYRTFRVAKLVSETEYCKSVYLIPVDGKPIVDFLPGQHLTLQFPVPGHPKPVIRCYTLSDAPNGKWYRISVKQAIPPRSNPDAANGVVSSFVNNVLKEGDEINIKSPSGSFFLQPGNRPIVLLAGGIGITPMLSIINHLANEPENNNDSTNASVKRSCLLAYGVRDGKDHTFREHLAATAKKNSNIHVINCYANPLPTDSPNQDYNAVGFVGIDMLKQALPSNEFDFYLCGPPPFMQSIFDGLTDWGVPEDRIFYEAFGPATIKKSKPDAATDDEVTNEASQTCKVRFATSDSTQQWSGSEDNLLDFIEEQGGIVESGCRSGNCGTCETRLLQGTVIYDDAEQVVCEPGHCLPCIAKPVGDIELDV